MNSSPNGTPLLSVNQRNDTIEARIEGRVVLHWSLRLIDGFHESETDGEFCCKDLRNSKKRELKRVKGNVNIVPSAKRLERHKPKCLHKILMT